MQDVRFDNSADYFVDWLRKPISDNKFEFRAMSSQLHFTLNLVWLDSFLSMHEGMLDTLVKLNLNGKPLDVPVRGAVPSQKHFLVSALRDGATAKIEQMETIHPNVSLFCLGLERGLCAKTSAKIFITPKGNAGYPPHLDSTDVLVIQLSGRKCWSIFEKIVESPISGMSRLMTEQEAKAHSVDIMMSPGDVLFVSGGVGHKAACNEDHSMHISIGIEHLTVYDILKHRLHELAIQLPELRKKINTEDPSTVQELIAGLNTFNIKAFDDRSPLAAISHVRRVIASTRPYHKDDSLASILTPPVVDKSSIISAVPWRNTEVVDSATRIQVYATGTVGNQTPLSAPSLNLPASAKPEVEALLKTQTPISLANLPGSLDIESRVLIAKSLLQMGLIELHTGNPPTKPVHF
ncbi:JmjC domain-containing protein [Iodobacter fluviatilis]|uniref:Cupin superfamily protein n=1 Tax=Iodobacter fluviatilis TaxID=537 RepID=A0A377STU3_9NEIS|nr:cupin domain-containing protein [Iodobacter fluviatilis]TCU81630.1 cupin superfamily protein [Iodobacter fluviatilis]STR44770.1 Cupin superfamily protein [Iodobacter fluviatilis]